MKKRILFLCFFVLSFLFVQSLFADGEKEVMTTVLIGTAQFDADGDCLSDGPYTFTLNFAGPTTFSTNPNAAGTFAVEVDDNATYVIESAFLPYQLCPASPYSVSLFVPAGVDTIDLGELIFTPDDFCTISGNVYLDIDNDCEFGSGEPPLEGWEVCVGGEFSLAIGGFTFSALTDATGFYTMEVPCGDHYFSCFDNPNPCDLCPLINEYITEDIVLDLEGNCGLENPGFIEGQVFIDDNDNCLNDGETPLANWTVAAVEIGTTDTTFAETDLNGNYQIIVSAGAYQVFPIDPTAGLWTSCNSPQVANVILMGTTVADFPMQDVEQCNFLTIEMATVPLRPCVTVDYVVEYCNQGTTLAEDAFLQFTLPPELTYQGSIPPTSSSGNVLTFDVGDLYPGQCGIFNLTVLVDCDAQIGEVICVEGQIFPQDPCNTPSPLWDQSNLEIEVECDENSEEVIFTITNTGNGNMVFPQPFVVIEDNVLLMEYMDTTLQLDAGESMNIVLPANGSTYIVQANQHPNHPTSSMVIGWSEGCGENENGSISIGIPAQYALGLESNSYLDVECQEVVAAFDPNIKRANPKGITNQHYIEPDTKLEYQIIFQNTGTASALEVVVRDTLPVELDPSTLRPLVASHQYDFVLENGNVAVFIFEDIDLPHEAADPEGSIGFIKFEINQTADNQPGTVIENEAAIYFDFNPPIFTPPAIHRIPLPEMTETTTVSLCAGEEFEGVVYTENTTLEERIHYLFFDSVFITEINILPSANYELSQTLCAGEGLTVNGTVYDETNPEGEELLTAMNGCDSTVHVSLSFLPSANYELSQTLCAGEGLTVNGTVYDETNPEGEELLTATNGCDSTVHVTLSFLPSANYELSQTLCSGENLTVNGTVYDETNPEGEEHLTATSGCDSTVQISLEFHPLALYDLDATLCEGESMTVNGTIYDASNPTGTETLVGASWQGCDSTVKVSLEFLPEAFSEVSATLCSGESMMVNGTVYDESSPTGEEVLISSNGCDSTVYVALEFLPSANFNLEQTLCAGEGLTVNGTVFDASNPSGSEVLTAANGCDSTVHISLSFLPAANGELSQTLCAGESLTINGTTYDEANPTGSETFAGASANGCDSTLEVSLTFLPEAFFELSENLCFGGSLIVNGTVYDEANPSGVEVLTASNGCDSTVFVSLTFDGQVMGNLDLTLCESESVTVNGTVYDSANPSGTELFPNGSYLGCDSTVMVSLDFYPPAESVFEAEICEDESVTVNGTTYNATHPMGTEVLLNSSANGCDSVVYVEVQVLGNSFASIDTIFSEGQFWGETAIFSDTSFTQILPSANGCDSLLEVHIMVETTAVKEVDGAAFDMQFFPNPTNTNRLFVQLHLPEAATASLFLVDAMGREVRRFFEMEKLPSGFIQKEFELGDLPSGVYHLVLVHSRGREVGKLVVLR